MERFFTKEVYKALGSPEHLVITWEMVKGKFSDSPLLG